MRMTHLVRLSLTAVLLGLCSAVQAQQPPAIDIPDAELRGGALQTRVPQIDTYLTYWAGQIKDGKDESTIVAARGKILAAYNQYDAAPFKSIYAQEAVKYLMPLLDASDALKNLRQVNAALALAKMPQLANIPAYDKMVAQNDAAVRYFGWMGYRDIRGLLLGQPQTTAEKFYKLLATAMAKETSATVLATMMDALNLAAVDMTAVSDENRKMAQNQSYQIFMASWPAICQKVINGDDAMIEPARAGAAAMIFLVGAVEGDKARATALLQSTADMMYCASSAYTMQLQMAERATGLTKADAMASSERLSYLLRDLENLANFAAKKTNNFLQTALTDSRVKDTKARAAGVELAVLKWTDDLKAGGVVAPKFTAPATTPASGPADASSSPDK